MKITTFAQRLRLLANELDQLQLTTAPLMIEQHNGSWQIFDEQGDVQGYASIPRGTVDMDKPKGR